MAVKDRIRQQSHRQRLSNPRTARLPQRVMADVPTVTNDRPAAGRLRSRKAVPSPLTRRLRRFAAPAAPVAPATPADSGRRKAGRLSQVHKTMGWSGPSAAHPTRHVHAPRSVGRGGPRPAPSRTGRRRTVAAQTEGGHSSPPIQRVSRANPPHNALQAN